MIKDQRKQIMGVNELEINNDEISVILLLKWDLFPTAQNKTWDDSSSNINVNVVVYQPKLDTDKSFINSMTNTVISGNIITRDNYNM